MKQRAPWCLAFISLACADQQGLPGNVEVDGGLSPDAVVITRPPDSGVTEPEFLPPTVTAVNPRSGPETGGTRVTLRGTSLVEPAQVFFGEAPATSIVVLDEVSIAATAPPGPVGPVTVRVTTPGGTAELPNGFTYHVELRLDAIDPPRVPDEGGVALTLKGRGFDDHTLVYLDRIPLRGARVVDAETIQGLVPALPPGRPEVRVVNREAAVRRGDLLVVYGTPDLVALASGFGPTAGGRGQEVAGDGLADAARVSIGGQRAGSLEVQSNSRLSLTAPALAEGAHDVMVENQDTSGTLAGGYIAFDPLRAGFAALGVTPNAASNFGGDTVTLVGRGFAADIQVAVGGRRALVGERTLNSVVVTIPAGLPVGATDILVVSGGSNATLSGALRLFAPIEVTAISPDRGPVGGGTTVSVSGSGFVAGVEVRIADVPLADVVVVSDTEITGRIVAGAGGPQDVVVRSSDTFGVLRGAFIFEEAFEVVRLEPNEGSVAGNTYVSVLGRGFTNPVAVGFGGTAGVQPILENSGIIGVRTAPARPGVVDVEIRSGTERVTLFSAYSFYDPRLITGGAWGPPIEGAVNVAVMNFDGEPMPNMVVQLGYDADPRYRALTDENGLATISGPELRGPQTVTAGATEVEFVTHMELESTNITMLASAYPQSMPPDAPRSPCPTPRQAPTIRGRVFRFKSSLDGETRPGWVPIAQVTYTDANVFSPNPPDPPEQIDTVFSDGEEFEIVVMRAGTVAVYAIMGEYNPETAQFIPRKLGIARSVPVAPETTTEGINVSLDFDLDQTTVIRLDQPPEQIPGPSFNAIFPFLNLQSDGVIPFQPTALQGTAEVLIQNLPRVAESSFFYMGGSFTLNNGQLTNPFSISFLESAQPFSEGVDLGPFLQMPENASPKLGELVENGRLSWEQGGITPDLTVINVVDTRGVSGCCCMDLNMNGQCEATEPEQCGGLPQQFNRWSIYGKGGLTSYNMPRMPSGLLAFESPRLYPWLLQQAIAPRFNYREFVYNQFSPFFWRSWSVWFSQFTVKEETD